VLLCLFSIYLYYFNACIKFLNKNAYIQVALKSSNFCTAAWNAFILILRNAPKFGFVAYVGTIFMYLGKFFIACSSATVAFILAAYWPWIRGDISSPVIPCITVFIIGYVVGSIFMSVYSIASNTILQCFILDYEIAKVKFDGGANHQPPSLQPFIDAVEAKHHGDKVRALKKAEKAVALADEKNKQNMA
jgi:hypothetical protein